MDFTREHKLCEWDREVVFVEDSTSWWKFISYKQVCSYRFKKLLGGWMFWLIPQFYIFSSDGMQQVLYFCR